MWLLSNGSAERVSEWMSAFASSGHVVVPEDIRTAMAAWGLTACRADMVCAFMLRSCVCDAHAI